MGEIEDKDLPVSRPLSDESQSLIEFGKKSITESINIINDYIKMMIPLCTSVITVYFALLKFLGIENLTSDMKANFSNAILTEPPFALLSSMIVFLIVLFPLLLRIQVGNITSIKRNRNLVLVWRYGGTGLGMALFLYGIYRMIIIVASIILPT